MMGWSNECATYNHHWWGRIRSCRFPPSSHQAPHLGFGQKGFYLRADGENDSDDGDDCDIPSTLFNGSLA